MRAKPNTASVYHTAAGIARREETEDANMLVVLSSNWKFGAVVLCNSSMYRSRFLSAPREPSAMMLSSLTPLSGGRIPSKFLFRHVVIGSMAAGAIVGTTVRVPPIFLKQSMAAISIPSATADEKAMLLAPWSRLPFSDAMATPMFLRDRNAFALDLVSTGKVSFSRAIRLADVAVREAYRRQVPPALVLGVLLTENDEVKSTARSRQGALGLMQIHPGPWRPALGDLFGRNLRNDTTNLRYGVYILGHLARRAEDTPEGGLQWRTALLRYNGCVRG